MDLLLKDLFYRLGFGNVRIAAPALVKPDLQPLKQGTYAKSEPDQSSSVFTSYPHAGSNT